MKLHIRHSTQYSYTWPVLYSIQHVRLTPLDAPGQQVLNWQVNAPVKAVRSADHFGNITHSISLNTPHRELHIVAEGIINTRPGASEAAGHLNPLVYVKPTPLTTADTDMQAFSSLMAQTRIALPQRLLMLAHAVADRVAYTKGSTTVAHTAKDAFEQAQGVCQDHAHVMLACLRAHGIPARYVSGYVFNPDKPEHDSHAWVEAFDQQAGCWVGVDATHRLLVADQHIKLATALDYSGASPVRGIRSGGGDESLQVDVAIVQA